MSIKNQIIEEVMSALETFTVEGFAEDVGFEITSKGRIIAEVYGPTGDVVATRRVRIEVSDDE